MASQVIFFDRPNHSIRFSRVDFHPLRDSLRNPILFDQFPFVIRHSRYVILLYAGAHLLQTIRISDLNAIQLEC